MLTFFLQAQGGGSSMLIIMIAMMVGFYFLMIRPQMRKQKQEKQFQESLKPGTKVVLTSGLHGKVVSVADDGVVIETMSGKLKFEKSSISRDFTQARFGASTAKETQKVSNVKSNKDEKNDTSDKVEDEKK